MKKKTRIALIHDYWVALRGGERVFQAFTRLFPEADCYALIRSSGMPFAHPRGARLSTSALQAIPFGARYFRALLPLYPLAARSLDLRGYDLVISSSSGFCHGARTDGAHLCYCYAPLRYAWNEYAAVLAGTPRIYRPAVAGALRYARRADYAAAQRVSAYVAISGAVRDRIQAYYGRDSEIVYPFVDVERFTPSSVPGEYLLVVAQLLPYKRVDLAVEACTRLALPLVVVGEGPERSRLEQLAGPTVRFAGRVSEEDLPRVYARCSALLHCGEEDFGIAPLEAQASGRPVVAYGAAGALETVIDGDTGLLFAEQSVAAVMDALARFDPGAFDPRAIRAQAERFDEAHFRAGIMRVTERVLAGNSGSQAPAPAVANRQGRSARV